VNVKIVSASLHGICCTRTELTKHKVEADLPQASHHLADCDFSRSQAHSLSNGHTHSWCNLSDHNLAFLLGCCEVAQGKNIPQQLLGVDAWALQVHWIAVTAVQQFKAAASVLVELDSRVRTTTAAHQSCPVFAASVALSLVLPLWLQLLQRKNQTQHDLQ
jgi:hypothetical protein